MDERCRVRGARRDRRRHRRRNRRAQVARRARRWFDGLASAARSRQGLLNLLENYSKHNTILVASSSFFFLIVFSVLGGSNFHFGFSARAEPNEFDRARSANNSRLTGLVASSNAAAALDVDDADDSATLSDDGDTIESLRDESACSLRSCLMPASSFDWSVKCVRHFRINKKKNQKHSCQQRNLLKQQQQQALPISLSAFDSEGRRGRDCNSRLANDGVDD